MARAHGRQWSGIGPSTGTLATVVWHVRRRRRGGRGRRKQRGAAWEPEQTWFVVSVRAVESRSCTRRGPARFVDAMMPLLQPRLKIPSATIVYQVPGTRYEHIIFGPERRYWIHRAADRFITPGLQLGIPEKYVDIYIYIFCAPRITVKCTWRIDVCSWCRHTAAARFISYPWGTRVL